jgi:hypothetical protein
MSLHKKKMQNEICLTWVTNNKWELFNIPWVIIYKMTNMNKTGNWKQPLKQEHKENNIAHETAICHKPHNSSNWDSWSTRQLGYKHTFCQNLVLKKNFLYFHKNMAYLNVGLWRICEVFLSPAKLCISRLWQITVSQVIYVVYIPISSVKVKA